MRNRCGEGEACLLKGFQGLILAPVHLEPDETFASDCDKNLYITLCLLAMLVSTIFFDIGPDRIGRSSQFPH